ncbi:MAG: hypothetical protein VKL39_24095, partial [Leptolyngbyaceae bacterium]|nr:hypothetical protein [Leptolyngbyaceae bacterium]
NKGRLLHRSRPVSVGVKVRDIASGKRDRPGGTGVDDDAVAGSARKGSVYVAIIDTEIYWGEL